MTERHPTPRSAAQPEVEALASIYAFVISCHDRRSPASAASCSADAKHETDHPAREDGGSGKDRKTGGES